MADYIKIIVLVCFYLLIGRNAATAQLIIKDSALKVYKVGATVYAEIPAGLLAKRFGQGVAVGGFIGLKTRTNWLFDLEYSYIYSANIRENGILDSISVKDPNYKDLINGNGTFQILNVYESGNLAFIKAGKIFKFLNHNPNSGLTAKIGIGFMEHKLFYYWTGEAPPQLTGNYIKGYDRLTYGPAVSQSIGYHHLGDNGRINYTFDIEAVEGFTYNQRAYDFDLMAQSTKQRLDVMVGIKAAWFFPIYGKNSTRAKYYY
jgi:hypothetical protein